MFGYWTSCQYISSIVVGTHRNRNNLIDTARVWLFNQPTSSMMCHLNLCLTTTITSLITEMTRRDSIFNGKFDIMNQVSITASGTSVFVWGAILWGHLRSIASQSKKRRIFDAYCFIAHITVVIVFTSSTNKLPFIKHHHTNYNTAYNTQIIGPT